MLEQLKQRRNTAYQAMNDAQLKRDHQAYIDAKSIFEQAVFDIFDLTHPVQAEELKAAL